MSEEFDSSEFSDLPPFYIHVGVPLTDYYFENDLEKFEFRDFTKEEAAPYKEEYGYKLRVYKITKPNYSDTYVTVYGDEKIIFYVETEKSFDNSKSAILKAMSFWEKSDQYFETIVSIKQINKTVEIDKLRKGKEYENSFMASKLYFDPNYIRNTSFIIWSDNSRGAMFESIKINYKKDDFKTEKDFGLGHNLNMRIRSNILKKETQLILDEIEKSGSFKNITDKFKAHNVFKDDDKQVILR